MALLVGRGKYLLQEEIGRSEVGRGLSGITYKAINQINHQLVVIKTFQPGLSQLPQPSELRKKFLNEAQRLLKCSHPNIIPYHEFFSDKGIPYLVMDYIAGKTLAQIVLPESPFPEATAIDYIRQVGAALRVVHHHGLLHRNLTPANLILRQDNQQVVLINFGLAREFNHGLVQTHTNLVSEGYAPLEQYLPKAKRTPATDLYGLAATLYTLVTAQIPIAATWREHISLSTPQQIRPELSNHISQAIMQGMALVIEERPPSVDEWLALLPKTQPHPTPLKTISSPSKQSDHSHDLLSTLLDQNKSRTVANHTFVQQSTQRQRLLKKIIIASFILLGLDYVWLKFQPRFHHAPTQPNTLNQRFNQ